MVSRAAPSYSDSSSIEANTKIEIVADPGCWQ